MSITRISPHRLVGAVALAQTLFLTWPMSANAEESMGTARGYERNGESAVPFNGSKGVDALIVRPTTFLTSLFSAGVFVVSLPFTVFDPAIDADKARENLVNYPFNDTFKRPLGDLDAMGAP